MAAGVTDRLGSVADIAELVEAAEEKPGKRRPYKKRGAAAEAENSNEALPPVIPLRPQAKAMTDDG